MSRNRAHRRLAARVTGTPFRPMPNVTTRLVATGKIGEDGKPINRQVTLGGHHDGVADQIRAAVRARTPTIVSKPPVHCPDCAAESGVAIPAQPCPHTEAPKGWTETT